MSRLLLEIALLLAAEASRGSPVSVLRTAANAYAGLEATQAAKLSTYRRLELRPYRRSHWRLRLALIPGSCFEVYLDKAFDGTGWRPQVRLPVARALDDTSIMFLVHPTLTSAEIEKTCAVIARVMALVSR